MATKKAPKTSDLERQYQELEKIFRLPDSQRTERTGSFEQPSPQIVVRSVTTYGAYEQPI